MKIRPLLFLALLLIGYSCNNSEQSANTDTQSDVNAATNFIRAALDGKFDQAKDYMLPDSANIHYLGAFERIHRGFAPETSRGYRESTIRIGSVKSQNDSTTIVVYSNSFKNNPDTLKVLRQNGKWLVDLKYLYEHDMDTTINKPRQDTLR